MEELHERLARVRKARGLTAKAVANAIGEAESTYRGWESGRGRKLPRFEQLSEVLSISVTELVVGQAPELNEALETLEKIEGQLRKLRLNIGSRI
jgi:transcriptional regulator with XRE-family HTH domain